VHTSGFLKSKRRLRTLLARVMQCLAIKLGLHCFLNDHADAASLQYESAYRDLVRLSGRDPAAEISARFREGATRRR
jgi:hypothetical protein